MICYNFICAYSRSEHGKILCDYNGLSDCNINRQMSCKRFLYLNCKFCGHEFLCFHQCKRSVSYSPDMSLFNPAFSAAFIEKAMQNDLVNAKRDVYYTSISEYILGYKAETTVKNLFKKYNKQFPQFTKDFLREAYYKSILYYLKNQ